MLDDIGGVTDLPGDENLAGREFPKMTPAVGIAFRCCGKDAKAREFTPSRNSSGQSRLVP